MQHLILRCKHCQREYVYCTYGNGKEYGTEKGCSSEYCAECQNAIDKALNKITVKFRPRWKNIDEPLLFPVFEKIKNDQKKIKRNELVFNDVTPFFMGQSIYDNIETYYHKGKKFMVEWNDDKPEEKRVSIMMEYDIINDRYTDKPWKYDSSDKYSMTKNFQKEFNKILKEKKIEETMEKPTGVLTWLDFENISWDISTPKTETEPIKHIQHTFVLVFDGKYIKSGVKNKTIKTGTGIDVEKLVDFIDYSCTFEKYDNENFETLIKIECD